MQIFFKKSQHKAVILLIPLVLITLGGVFGSQSAPTFNQQEMITVTGNVSDTLSGEVLSGVTIQIKGTTTGTITDMEGNYSIVVNSDDILVFSLVGYKNKEIAIQDETDIDVQLAEDIIRSE